MHRTGGAVLLDPYNLLKHAVTSAATQLPINVESEKRERQRESEKREREEEIVKERE